MQRIYQRFILKYYVPDNLEVSKYDHGLMINGPKMVVGKCKFQIYEVFGLIFDFDSKIVKTEVHECWYLNFFWSVERLVK